MVLSYWTNAAATIPYSTPGMATSGIYYIKGTNPATGCYVIAPVTAVVNPLPTVFNSTGSGSYCASGPGLEIGLVGSQVGVMYSLWYGCCTQLPILVMGTGGPISFGMVTQPGSYTVHAENLTTHCQNWMYNCITVTVEPATPVSVTVTASANVVPAGTIVTYTAAPVNGGSSPAYQWQVNGANAGTNIPTFAYVPVDGDEVRCILTSSLPCTTGPATSNEIVMNVSGLGTTSYVIGIIPDGGSRCYGATQTLMVAGNGNTFTVQNGAEVTLVAGQNIRLLPGTTVEPGGYLHGYISQNGEYCGKQSATIPATVTGTGEVIREVLTGHAAFRIYPNPTDGDFTVEQVAGPAVEDLEIGIVGIRGERLGRATLDGERKRLFHTDQLAPGVYFVRITGAGYSETLKLVKTR